MKSIRKTLTRRLSISISLIVIAVLLMADIAVDSWMENEFNATMHDKVSLLKTLVNEGVEGVEFDFAGGFMPEFEGRTEPEYYQLWYDGEVFERSNTLTLHSKHDLPFKTQQTDSVVFDEIVLPDGRTGRVAYARFTPQIDSAHREEVLNLFAQQQTSQKPIFLAYAKSIEKLNYYLWFIDLSFALAIITIPLLIRFAVKNTVSYVLTPLETLNQEIKAIRFSNTREKIAITEPTEELLPIIEGLNHFIDENYSLFLREKRLTSDIAHELKTPVTELINMAEVAIKFPSDKDLEVNFKPEVLKISSRMKNIISSLMLLHKFSYQRLACNDEIELFSVLDKLIKNADESRLVRSENVTQLFILTNTFALESILTNLITNALQHSPTDSLVKVKINQLSTQEIQIAVYNRVKTPLTPEELSVMFEPLWQKDQSRTSAENFGLGLSIAKVLANAIGAQLTVASNNQEIQFELKLPENTLC